MPVSFAIRDRGSFLHNLRERAKLVTSLVAIVRQGFFQNQQLEFNGSLMIPSQ